jgi:8-hydroxy-5-deazaflavin:NADPH oxidoreductase
MKTIAVLGSGNVGETLANGFLKHGHEVMRGSRDPKKLAAWQVAAGAKAKTGTFAEAARFGQIAVLAVKGTAALEVAKLCDGGLDGKLVLDATNPIADAPPEDGVVPFFTGPNDSLLERLQKATPAARFVKAFSSVGAALMVNPSLGGQRPSMFICGDDAAAREETRGILAVFGWDTEDMGTAKAARAIEPLCMLWCIPGFRKNDWMHAFKVIRA